MSTAKYTLFRIAIGVLIVAFIVFGIYWYWSGMSNDQNELRIYGNVEHREVELAFVIQERITRVLVEEGDRVTAGQLLAELDSVRYRQAMLQREAEMEVARQQLNELIHGSRPEEIRRSRAELASAQANQRDAALTHKRLQELVKKKLASAQDVDNAKAALDAAHARVEAARQNLLLVEAGPRQESIAAAKARLKGAEAALERARKDLKDTQLLATSDGILQARILEPGDIAGPQKPVFTLALTNPLWVRAYVAQPDLAKVQPGMIAEVYSDAFPNKAYEGKVGFISPSAEFTPKTVQTEDVRSTLVYQVRVIVPNPHNELRLGMPVTVKISLKQQRGNQQQTDKNNPETD